MKMLHNQQSKIVNYNGQNYAFNFPNVGKKMEIENFKILLTNGGYGDIARSNHITGNNLLNQVDAFAHIVVLLPDLKYKITDFLEMSELDAIKMGKLYKDQIKPFLTSCQNEIDALIKEELADEPAE